MTKLKWSAWTLAMIMALGMATLQVDAVQAGTPNSANQQKWDHFSPQDTHSNPNAGAGAQYQMDQNAIQWWTGANNNASLPSWLTDQSQWQAMPGQGYALLKGTLEQTQWQTFTNGQLGGWVDSNKDGIHDMFEMQTAWNAAGGNQLGTWMDSNNDGIHDAFEAWPQSGGGNQGGTWDDDYDNDNHRDDGWNWQKRN